MCVFWWVGTVAERTHPLCKKEAGSVLSVLAFPSRSAPAGLGAHGDRGAHAQDCSALGLDWPPGERPAGLPLREH